MSFFPQSFMVCSVTQSFSMSTEKNCIHWMLHKKQISLHYSFKDFRVLMDKYLKTRSQIHSVTFLEQGISVHLDIHFSTYACYIYISNSLTSLSEYMFPNFPDRVSQPGVYLVHNQLSLLIFQLQLWSSQKSYLCRDRMLPRFLYKTMPVTNVEDSSESVLGEETEVHTERGHRSV